MSDKRPLPHKIKPLARTYKHLSDGDVETACTTCGVLVYLGKGGLAALTEDGWVFRKVYMHPPTSDYSLSWNCPHCRHTDVW